MAMWDAVPDIRPRAGHDLLIGIDNVLSRLAETHADTDHDRVAEDLMTALVRCAACGDISRVRAEADAVRRAAAYLRDGRAEHAGAILAMVRADLLP